MTTLPNMGLTLPTRGAPGAGQWGDTLDADLQFIDAHDHTPGKGARITSAALNINADVSWSSLFAPTSLHRVQFSSVAALSSNAQNKSIFVADGTGGLSANELYWRNNTGNNVKLTSGNALNVAAFVGGIGGDYTAVAAALNFDDSGKRYTHKDGSGNWARIASGEIRLIETGTTEAVFVGHQAPAALAASYTVTWPLAVPGSTAIMQMDSAGVLTASNTVGQAATFSSLLTASAGITATASTFSGLITASAGATAAANQHFTVSGTGDFKHGTNTLIVPVTTPQAPGLATASLTLATSNLGATVGIPLRVGARILAIRAVITDNVTGPTKLVVRLSSAVAGSGFSTVATGAQSAGNGTLQTISVTGLTTTLVAGSVFYATVLATTGSASCTLNTIEVDYDVP